MGARRVEMVTWKWPQNNDRNDISPQFEPTVSKCKDKYIIFTCALTVLLWELCLIRHKAFYKIQFSFYRPWSFQYTSINRQRLINVSPLRQSNKKLLPSFAITSGTKENSVTVPDTVCIMKNVFPVRLGLWISFCRMWSRKMVVVLLFLCLKGKCLVSTEKIKRELNFIGWFTMSVVQFS